jgi:peptidoglycan/LPS O-acetylase OafA/YrhL
MTGPTVAPATPESKSSSRSPAAYRPDIDGLRALAIIPVLLFHGGFSAFRGGFVGVDVFFVVSGFLITSLVQREIEAGTFSYVAFWERRARRLLPPMFLVIFVSCGIAFAYFLPEDLEDFGASVFATSTFLSNVYFWLVAGYFSTPDAPVPLIHTWSLAIEEQFYFFFPAVLMLLAATARTRRLSVIALIGGLSFTASLLMVDRVPDGAFYLLPSRIWELMLGALLALLPATSQRLGGLADALLSIGLLVIAGAVVLYDASTPFPGVAALAPCLATALLIWVGDQPGSVLKHLFTNRVSVHVGRRSYALYLWHWPLLVFWATWSNKPLSTVSTYEVAAVLSLSFVLASLSLRFVEDPIRRRKLLSSRTSIFTLCLVCLSIPAAFGLAAYLNGGFSDRVPRDVLLMANGNDLTEEQAACGAGPICRIGVRENVEPTFLVWGDSHATALLEVIDETAREHGLGGLTAAQGGCPPVFDVTLPRNNRACTERNNAVRELLDRSELEAVILVGLWSAYLGEAPIASGAGAPDDELSAGEVFARQLRLTAAHLAERGARVYLVDEPPYPVAFRPARVAFAMWHRSDSPEVDRIEDTVGLSVQDYRERTRRSRALFEELIADVHIQVVPQEPFLCVDAFCPAVYEGRSIFRDNTHLNNHGATKLAGALRPIFRDIAGSGE